MKTILSLLAFLAAFTGTGYLLLRFFTLISGVDMLAAYAWGFRARRLELVLPLAMLHLIAFIFTLAIAVRPVTLAAAIATNRGGLAGYPAGDGQYVYYDIGKASYVRVDFFSPPPATESLRGTFGVVSMYRPFTSKVYQNLVTIGLPVTLLVIFFSVLGTTLSMLVLRALAQDYSGRDNPALKLARGALGEGFRRVTGMPLATAAITAVAVLAGIALASTLVTERITRNHREVLGERSRRYRAEIERRVRPGTRLAGRIASRIEVTQAEYEELDERSRRRPSLRGKTYHSVIRYTVELQGVLGMPVFVGVEKLADPGKDPGVVLYEGLAARAPATAQFIVNDNYTVRLAGPGE